MENIIEVLRIRSPIANFDGADKGISYELLLKLRIASGCGGIAGELLGRQEQQSRKIVKLSDSSLCRNSQKPDQQSE
jgi:hypothetical protein